MMNIIIDYHLLANFLMGILLLPLEDCMVGLSAVAVGLSGMATVSQEHHGDR
jgi:hypothetical protein